MKDFLVENCYVIISAAVSLVVATIGLVTSRINSKRLKELASFLTEAKARGTYTVCPHCRKEIPLQDLHFYIDGHLDDDLDGKPDN